MKAAELKAAVTYKYKRFSYPITTKIKLFSRMTAPQKEIGINNRDRNVFFNDLTQNTAQCFRTGCHRKHGCVI